MKKFLSPFPVVAIDGPAGAGKSSVAQKIAAALNMKFLDTGAIYRALAWWLDYEGIRPTDTEGIAKALSLISLSMNNGRVVVCGHDVTEAIRDVRMDAKVSAYAAIKEVRSALLDLQRSEVGRGLVAEGRDMGTVVFPDADVKLFLTAAPEKRAQRRYEERLARGEAVDYDEILHKLIERDRMDVEREIAPLRQAEDAVLLDTTDLSFDETVAAVLSLIEGK